MQRKGCKEIELSNYLKANRWLETGGFISSEEIAEEILCSEKLVETEDDKMTTEKEMFLLVEGQREKSTVREFTQQRRAKFGVMQACNQLKFMRSAERTCAS